MFFPKVIFDYNTIFQEFKEVFELTSMPETTGGLALPYLTVSPISFGTALLSTTTALCELPVFIGLRFHSSSYSPKSCKPTYLNLSPQGFTS